MRRPIKRSSPRLSADSQRLVVLAQAIAQAGSRLEQRAWEQHADTLVRKLLKSGHQESIDAALDSLFNTELGAYDALMESVEANSETCTLEHDGISHDAVLVALPILAWTRFTIASGTIAGDMLSTLSAHLQAHVLAAGTRVALAPTLYAIDQLPRSFPDTFALTQRMAQAALKGAVLPPLANPPETAPFLADTRYLLATVIAPVGAPLFRWQEQDRHADPLAARAEALKQWQTQAAPTVARLLPGCGVELLLPESYYVACREADRKIRPASIRAAVHYLTHTLGVEAAGLQAVIGSFSEESGAGGVDEYRISFLLRNDPAVIYGVVWPLYGAEDEQDEPDALVERIHLTVVKNQPQSGDQSKHLSPFAEILALLRESGITHIKHHEEHFALEFCEDCGAPLYCDMQAELVHAEMPEDIQKPPGHFH